LSPRARHADLIVKQAGWAIGSVLVTHSALISS
jgi:hypothetical protein